MDVLESFSVKFIPNCFSVLGGICSFFDELVSVLGVHFGSFVGHTVGDKIGHARIFISTGRAVMSDRGGKAIFGVGVILFINSDTYQFVGHKSLVHWLNDDSTFFLISFNLIIEVCEVLHLECSCVIVVEDDHVASVVFSGGRAYNT